MNRIILALLALAVLQSVAIAGDFASLVGGGPKAADAWLGKPTSVTSEYRDYMSGGYNFVLWYDGDTLKKVTIAIFPKDKKPRDPNQIAAMIEAGSKVGTKGKQGILETYFMADSKNRVWRLILTPGDNGEYDLVNIEVPIK